MDWLMRRMNPGAFFVRMFEVTFGMKSEVSSPTPPIVKIKLMFSFEVCFSKRSLSSSSAKNPCWAPRKSKMPDSLRADSTPETSYVSD